MRCYDFHFVPRWQNVNEYREKIGLSDTKVIHLFPAWCLPRCSIRETESMDFSKRYDVVFIGFFETRRLAYISYLLKHGIKVHVPHDWPSIDHTNYIRFPCKLWGDEYQNTIREAYISLGF